MDAITIDPERTLWVYLDGELVDMYFDPQRGLEETRQKAQRLGLEMVSELYSNTIHLV